MELLVTVHLSFSPITIQVRIHPDPEPQPGSPFDGTFIVQIMEDEAYISGYVGPGLTVAAGRALKKYLHSLGVTKARWKKVDGREVTTS